MFNCFEFDSKNNEILVTITKILLDEDVTEENVARKLKLDALIIADKTYLDKTWGKDKVFDMNYKKNQAVKKLPAANRRLVKKRVQWLIEHSTLYQLLCWIDN